MKLTSLKKLLIYLIGSVVLISLSTVQIPILISLPIVAVLEFYLLGYRLRLEKAGNKPTKASQGK